VIDPGLKADIRAEKPWTMSPLLCAMNIFNVSNIDVNSTNIIPLIETSNSRGGNAVTPYSPATINIKKSLERHESESWICTDTTSLEECNTLLASGKPMGAEARKKYFLKESNRKEFKLTPEYVYGFDFYNKYLDLGELKIRLPGFSIGMVDYWDMPIKYVCRSRDASVTFFVVEMDLV
jgi:hypothetical protein